MIRHGVVVPSAAGIQPPATDPRAFIDTIAADSVGTSLLRDRLDCAEAQRCGLSVSIPAHPSSRRAVADIGRSTKSP